MKKIKLWSFFLVVILSMLLVACSSSDSDGSAQENTRKILIFGHGGTSTALDPAYMQEGDSFSVIANLYETLVSFGEQATVIAPSLAEAWELADDGLTYTITLREDVIFHDGTDFNADAVVKNFERWANGNVEEFHYYNSVFGGESPVIQSVTAEGDDTVLIKLNHPQESFLTNLTMGAFSIVSPTAFEQGDDEFGSNLIGTGPFRFAEGQLNESITVVKFEDYWQEGLPKLNKIIFKSIPNDIARLNALIAKDIDLADNVNLEDRLQIDNGEDLQFFERPTIENIYEGIPLVPNVDSMLLFGATKELVNFIPGPVGFDVLSKVEIELQLEE